MNRILFVILAALLIVSIFASCYAPGSCGWYWATVEDISIWTDESLPPGYFLYVVAGYGSCDQFSAYEVTHVGNVTLQVVVFRVTCYPDCPVDRYATHNISLGSDFVPGVNYTVEVNDVTVTSVSYTHLTLPTTPYV